MWVPENFKLHMYLYLWLIFRLDSSGLGKGSGEKRENIPHWGTGYVRALKKSMDTSRMERKPKKLPE